MTAMTDQAETWELPSVAMSRRDDAWEIAFSVTAIVLFSNRPHQTVHVLLLGADADAARDKARLHIRRQHPRSTVVIARVWLLAPTEPLSSCAAGVKWAGQRAW
ncbi:hypothetical protein [Streptomyces sp. MNP-20]|uniref:hypothetical protein n=1 Tax=Streptomyces sp. MNP-20 TaxID=2721165 RepID=UPI001556396C|nr:hypothetical protein [Streptomyces sp. MNP-20]